MSVIPGIIVDTSNIAVFPFGVNPWQGPVKYAGNLWIAAVNGVGAAVTPFWYKSTDGGLTWSDEDTANAPAILRPASYAYPFSAGSKWYYCQADNAQVGGQIDVSLDIFEFDMTTGWNTTPITTMVEGGGAKITLSGNPTCLICLRGTQPNFALFYGPDSPNQLSAQVYASGTWGSVARATTVTPLPPNSLPYSLRAAVVDNSSQVHLVLSSGTDKISYVRFDVGGNSFNSVTDILTTTSAGSANAKTPLIFKPDTDELIFPVKESTASPLFHGFKILRGTPTSGPVWTVDSVDLQAFFPRSTYFIRNAHSLLTSVEENYSTLYLAFTTLNDDDETEQKLWYIKNDGSGWSDPILVWDISNNPPQNFPGDWSVPQSDGMFGGTIAPGGNDLYFTEYGLYTLTSPSATICGIITFADLTLAVARARCRIGNYADSQVSPAGCYID